MNVLIGALITFLVVILVLYLVNMLPIDGRAKQIVRVVVIVLGIHLAVAISRGLLGAVPCRLAPHRGLRHRFRRRHDRRRQRRDAGLHP